MGSRIDTFPIPPSIRDPQIIVLQSVRVFGTLSSGGWKVPGLNILAFGQHEVPAVVTERRERSLHIRRFRKNLSTIIPWYMVVPASLIDFSFPAVYDVKIKIVPAECQRTIHGDYLTRKLHIRRLKNLIPRSVRPANSWCSN